MIWSILLTILGWILVVVGVIVLLLVLTAFVYVSIYAVRTIQSAIRDTRPNTPRTTKILHGKEPR